MIFLSKLMLKWVNWFLHYLHHYTYLLSPELFIFKGQFAIFRPLISVCTKRNNTYKKSAKSSVWKNS